MSNKRNKKVREELERIYGKICMLHEGLKIKGYKYCKARYSGKSLEKQLTLHHIIPKSKGGETSIKNGAVLCRGCHDFLEQTSQRQRDYLNKKLQEYKKCKVEFVEEVKLEIDVAVTDFIPEEKEKYDRAKKKQEDRKEINEGYVKWLEEKE